MKLKKLVGLMLSATMIVSSLNIGYAQSTVETDEESVELSLKNKDDAIINPYSRDSSDFEFSETDFVYAVEGGNIYFNEDSGTITCADESVISAHIPNKINGIEVLYIGYSAFYDCKELKEITLPDSIISISNYAFYGCESLTEVTIPDSVTSYCGGMFYNCTNLRKVKLSENITGIVYDTFNGCTSLTDVIIPNSIKSIGCEAFNNCYSLKEITLPDNLNEISDYAFYGCNNLQEINIPNNVKKIGDKAFYDCSRLEEIILPDSVTSLGKSAFYNCSNLKKAELSRNIKKIDDYTFYNCSNLSEVIIKYATSIGSEAFRNCSSLKKVTFPKYTYDIRSQAFYNCSSLTEITFSEHIRYIDAEAFYNCQNLKKVNFADDSDWIESIGEKAFSNCSSLAEIAIPDGIKSIGEKAFSNCTDLKKVYISNGIAAINYGIFENCNNLTEITIPNSVIGISNLAFDQCNSLTDVYYLGTAKEWYAINIGSYNECLTNATIHFKSDETNTETGTETNTTKGKLSLSENKEYEVGTEAIYFDGLWATLSNNSDDIVEGVWESSNTDVVEIIKTQTEGDDVTKSFICNINCKAIGTSVVTLTLSNGLSASCNVTVKQPICVVSSYCQETESVYIPERKSTINYVIEFNEPVKIKQGGKIYITEADSMPNSKVYTNNNGALANLMEIENTDVMDYIDDNNHKKINLLMHLIDENNKLSLPSETDISIYFDNGVLEPESSYSKLPMTDDNKFIKLVTNSGDLYKLRTEPGYRFYNETYSFEHTGESFYGSDYNGYNSYEISDSFKKELNKRGVSWKTIWGMFSPTWTEAFSCNLQWGGSCSGMTILALLNKIDPQYKNNINTNGQHISNLYKFPKPSETRNIEGGLRDQINYLQALTNSKYYNIVGAFDNNFVSNIKNEEQYTDKYPDMLKTIVEKSQSLNTGYSADKAFVLSMHFLMKGTNEIDGHAVLPFYCEKQGDYYYIYCYDVNSKDMPICLRISSDYSELYSELYHEDSRIEMIVAVGYTNYSDIIKLVNNEIDSIDTVEPYDNNSTTCIQIEVNGDFTIYNKDYSIKYDNGQISGDTEIIKDISINNVSGIGNSTLIFELYGDDFSISNSGDKNLNCSFEGNGNNIAVVASNADSVSFNSLSGLSIEGDSTNYNALVSLDKSDKNYASISGSDSKNVKLNYDENNNIVFTSDNDSDAVVNIYNEIDLISTDNVIENNDIITVDNTDDNFIYGDVDNDGVITSSDASFALQKSLDDSFNLPLQDKTEDWFRYANVDGDNTLSANDAAFILQKSLDMSFKFEVEE